ncbi:MAG: ribosome silencing factor [Gammaproteobacteria bacterium]|nr:ribosome silencing factor [Gammaproteobacteria bacterium]MCZ6578298.1 ribosome silencing factor [Gammaproteobacteria bacterium]MCZ6882458.1 ribosome silencing factor [Gammaproteobacteria bacterium]
MNKSNQSSPASLQAEAIKKVALQALEELKAENIQVIDVRIQASFTDYMIFASGKSSRHVKSIAGEVIDAAKLAKMPPLGVEGEDVGEWVLVDLGDVVVHVMLPDTRLFYDLEKLWGEELVDTGYGTHS